MQPWLWPNLVSLDAPAVAVLWQVLLARGLHAKLDPLEPLMLGLAVWCVYVSDQLLDALRPAPEGWQPARKAFHRKYFRIASTAGVCLMAAVLPIAYWLLPGPTFKGGVVLGVAVACYFAGVHLAPAGWRSRWPREAVVAFLFTLGTFMGVWMENGRDTGSLEAPAVVFGLLCWVNCSAIESWEWQKSVQEVGEAPSASARWVAAHLAVIGSGIALLATLVGLVSAAPMGFAAAAVGSGAALAVLGKRQSDLPVNFLRVAADVALLTPVVALVIPFVAPVVALTRAWVR